jgi:hypothetical protein
MAIEQTTVSKKDALNSNNALKTNCNLSTSKFHQKHLNSKPTHQIANKCKVVD